MCGIGGVWLKDKIDTEQIYDLILKSSLRGEDSTGICIVGKNGIRKFSEFCSPNTIKTKILSITII